jgi:hypothetical protein
MAVALQTFEPVRARIALPTGLDAAEIRGLHRSEKVLLEGWHRSVAGNDNGRPWLPAAIRRLSIDARLALAGDDDLDTRWKERERRRAAIDVAYFTEGYGHVRAPAEHDDEAGGAPVPFLFWPRQPEAARTAVGAADQRAVLDIFLRELLVVVLKARQLGLTWLALHYGYHLIALDPDTPNAVVLGLSQDGGYAKRLLERVREINDLMPPFLRGIEDRETADSKTEMKLIGRGRMVSLPGTPGAPRSWQADLAIGDEWAFVRNGQAGPTTRALLPAARQVILISSGDGPPDEEGWHQYFAQTYSKAAAGENEWTPIFLPDATRPGRTKAWRERQRDNFDTEEDFLSEHPETDDDAMVGTGRDRYFALSEIAAAVRLGAELDELMGTDEMPPPAGEAIHLGVDWGEASHAVIVWPLEAGGIYVAAECVCAGVEPGETTERIHATAAEIQSVSPQTGRVEPPIGEERYDSAGAQSNRTFLATARARFTHQYAYGEVRSRKVPFSQYKTETAGYLRRLFRRAGAGRSTGVIAISPTCTELLRQARALESGPGGVWKKADDQHGPDALVAGAQRIAKVHRQLSGGKDD